MKYSYYSFAISRLFQCLFCSPVSVQFTSYRNLKTSSSQVLTGSCSDCRIPAVIRFIDLVSPQYWAQAAEYCNSGQKKENTAGGFWRAGERYLVPNDHLSNKLQGSSAPNLPGKGCCGFKRYYVYG